MKRALLFSVLAVLISGSLIAQAPQGISHQAVIRDTEGKLVTNKTIGIQVSILQSTTEGTVVYSETHDPMSNMNGLITYVIGKGAVVQGVFAGIDWSVGPYFLKTEVDPAGGTSYSIEGTVQLQSVPYALHARTSEDAFKGDMKGAPITNLADPTGAQDAATKAYVDLLEAKINELKEALFPSSGTFTDDRDQQTYKWIRIGNQVWMAENLNFITANSWCYENNTTYCGHYGRLYTFTAAVNACPAGWHLPSHEEWTELERHGCAAMGNIDCSTKFPFDITTWGWQGTNEGNALKSCRQVSSPLGSGCNTSEHPRWSADITHNGPDEFGFSALPGGYRNTGGSFYHIGSNGAWWTSTDASTANAWARGIQYNTGGVFRNDNDKAHGFSIRCVRD